MLTQELSCHHPEGGLARAQEPGQGRTAPPSGVEIIRHLFSRDQTYYTQTRISLAHFARYEMNAGFARFPGDASRGGGGGGVNPEVTDEMRKVRLGRRTLSHTNESEIFPNLNLCVVLQSVIYIRKLEELLSTVKVKVLIAYGNVYTSSKKGNE